jgi:hypothetical protein
MIEQEIREIACNYCQEIYGEGCHKSDARCNPVEHLTSKLLSLLSQHYIPKSELPTGEELIKLIVDEGTGNIPKLAQAIHQRIMGEK